MRKLTRIALITLCTGLVARTAAGAKPDAGKRASDRKADRRDDSKRDRRDDARAFDTTFPTTSPDDPVGDSNAPSKGPATAPSDQDVAGVGTTRGDKGDRRTQGEQAADAMREQRRIGKALKDGYQKPKDETSRAAVLTDLQSRLDAEDARHDAAMAELHENEQAAANNSKQLKKIRKSIDAENDQHDRKSADLRRQMQDLRAQAD